MLILLTEKKKKNKIYLILNRHKLNTKRGIFSKMRIIGGTARGTKLYTLEGENTRPTLDRVKESLFNIIQRDIPQSVFLDLFSGSGAIGLEAVSRGAKKAILCDNSKDAVNIIKKNIEKTHFQDNIELYKLDYETLLKDKIQEKLDIIYIDPPYKTNYIQNAVNIILEKNLIDEKSIIILETDDEKRIIEQMKNLNINITNQRKYGRANLIFLQK